VCRFPLIVVLTLSKQESWSVDVRSGHALRALSGFFHNSPSARRSISTDEENEEGACQDRAMRNNQRPVTPWGLFPLDPLVEA
jgi:hypothetical protein